MKKLLNEKEKIVEDLIEGYVLAYPNQVQAVPGTHIVKRREPKEKGKVRLIVGNGPGHEPCLLGMVGKGALDLDVLGEIFAAPSYQYYFEGIQDLDDGSPILMAVMNHAGDVLNSDIALDMAKDEGIDIESCLFYDDIASAPKECPEERRGMTGYIFFCKIVGAMAEEGRSRGDCIKMFENIRHNCRTLGLAIAPCTHPISEQRLFELPEDECEIGSGAHGEGGAIRIRMTDAKTIVGQMCEMLVTDRPYDRGDEVLVIVNGSGSTTMMELNIVYKETYHYLKARGIMAVEGLIGNYMTTQEAAGFTISLLKLEGEMKKYWNAPCDAPYFRR